MKNRNHDDDDDEIEDGATLRTPLALMDGRDGRRVFLTDTVRFDENDQPHFLRATDETDARAAARDARDEMIRRAENAWCDARRKKPPSDDDDDGDDDGERRGADAQGIADARQAAYDAYVRRLTNAWRTPTRDFAEPDTVTRPEDLARRHLRTDPDDDAQARRDAAYRNYTTRLTEAWKNPPGVARAERGRTDPRAASRIERQGEQWRGGR
jgi:hypothetical protein